MSRQDAKSNRQRYVNMWGMPGVHLTNVDLLQRLKSADDRQFSGSMDVTGVISERADAGSKWSETHRVGIRTDIWQPDKAELERAATAMKQQQKDLLKKQIRRSGDLTVAQEEEFAQKLADDGVMDLTASDVVKRRLVLKLFRTTAKRIRWCGTIEEISTTEVHNSIGSKCAILSLAVILPGYEYLTIIQQNHRTMRVPSLFSFCFLDEKHDRMWHVLIRRKWASVGADYVVEANGQPVGLIDGRLFSFGYNASIEVREPLLAKNSRFLDMMTLFASSIGYHKAMRKSIRRRVAATLAGRSEQHVVESEELWLRKNPRRFAA